MSPGSAIGICTYIEDMSVDCCCCGSTIVTWCCWTLFPVVVVFDDNKFVLLVLSASPLIADLAEFDNELV